MYSITEISTYVCNDALMRLLLNINLAPTANLHALYLPTLCRSHTVTTIEHNRPIVGGVNLAY